MKRIAVYGGSFDPPHKGHKLLAKNLAEKCGAEKVIIIPASVSPFKSTTSANAEDRLEMCRLAFFEDIYCVSDIEISRGGKSYTVDTLKQLKEENPDTELFLFMGDDMLLSFDKWYRYGEILELCTLVCACRTQNLKELENMKSFVRDVLRAEDRVLICECVPYEISSTEIRASLKDKKTDCLSASVYNYITEKGLYK